MHLFWHLPNFWHLLKGCSGARLARASPSSNRQKTISLRDREWAVSRSSSLVVGPAQVLGELHPCAHYKKHTEQSQLTNLTMGNFVMRQRLPNASLQKNGATTVLLPTQRDVMLVNRVQQQAFFRAMWWILLKAEPLAAPIVLGKTMEHKKIDRGIVKLVSNTHSQLF